MNTRSGGKAHTPRRAPRATPGDELPPPPAPRRRPLTCAAGPAAAQSLGVPGAGRAGLGAGLAVGAPAPGAGQGAGSPEQNRQRGEALAREKRLRGCAELGAPTLEGGSRSGGGAGGRGAPAPPRPSPSPSLAPALTQAGRRPPGSGSASGRRRRSVRTAARPRRPRTRRIARRTLGPADGRWRSDPGRGEVHGALDPAGAERLGGARRRAATFRDPGQGKSRAA